VIKNVRYTRVENLEIQVAVLDRNRVVLGEAVARPLPQPIDLDDYREFEVLVKGVKPAPGLLVRYQVNYLASSGQSSYPWSSSFLLDAATGQQPGIQKSKDLDW